MHLDPRQQSQLHGNLARLQRHAAAQPLQARVRFEGLWTYLQTCEADLVLFMQDRQPDVPQTELEWGLALYLLNNKLSAEEVSFLRRFLGMPTSNITPEMVSTWETTLATTGVLCDDGTLVAETKWALFDPGWILAFTSYLIYYAFPSEVHVFPTTPVTVALDGTRPITLGLVSDWGTGPCADGDSTGPGEAVVAHLKRLAPDIFVHLGDTYYAGLGEEEQAGLLTPLGDWAKPAFTLNSNHEMYDGANGYFGTALAPNGPFAGQNGTSYFALTYNNIVILGLDTAFFDRSELCMDGALTDAHQIAFLRSLNLDGKTVIVLTHHNGLDITGNFKGTPPVQLNPLWDQVCTALGRNPDFWYWGHLHNDVVYTAETDVTGPTRARCIGHAALPFGRAKVLYNPDGGYIASVQYSASKPLPNPDPEQSLRVLNGFATVTLRPDGSIEETFYNQDGTGAWSSGSNL